MIHNGEGEVNRNLPRNNTNDRISIQRHQNSYYSYILYVWEPKGKIEHGRDVKDIKKDPNQISGNENINF